MLYSSWMVNTSHMRNTNRNGTMELLKKDNRARAKTLLSWVLNHGQLNIPGLFLANGVHTQQTA